MFDGKKTYSRNYGEMSINFPYFMTNQHQLVSTTTRPSLSRWTMAACSRPTAALQAAPGSDCHSMSQLRWWIYFGNLGAHQHHN